MKRRAPLLALLASVSLLSACGSDGDTTDSPGNAAPVNERPANDMRDVSGERDAVEADGTISLSGPERSTCQSFVAQAGQVHQNMASLAGGGAAADGWQSATAGLSGWLVQLQAEINKAETPEFEAALQSIADAGAGALEAREQGRQAEADDVDPAAFAEALSTTAGLCESAGINITWHS